jgi:uncharacterized protein YihD (DUF1040 family)
MDIEIIAKDILVALLSNPERYKYIAKLVESKKITQEEANLKNINKAFKIASSFQNRLEELKKEVSEWQEEQRNRHINGVINGLNKRGVYGDF